MDCLARNEFISIIGLFIAYFTLLCAAAVVPEIRVFLGLGQSNVTANRKRRLFMWFSIYLAIWSIIGIIIWVFLCMYFAKPEITDGEKKPFPLPTAVEIPSPTFTKTPVKEFPCEEIINKTIGKCPPVQVDGLEFTLYVFSKKYYWKYNSLDVLFLKKPVTEQEMKDHLSNIHRDMQGYDAIVGVGTASYDFNVEKGENGKEDEENRAKDRAALIIEWLRENLNKPVQLYSLNLGHYTEPNDEDWQRPIVIFGIKKIQPKADIKQILSKENNKLLREELVKKQFKFDLDKYSLFETEPES